MFIGSAVVDFYAKLTGIKEAQRGFEDTQEPKCRMSFLTQL